MKKLLLLFGKRQMNYYSGEGFGARDLISKSNVKALCTTDDPIDSLEYHIKIKEDTDLM